MLRSEDRPAIAGRANVGTSPPFLTVELVRLQSEKTRVILGRVTLTIFPSRLTFESRHLSDDHRDKPGRQPINVSRLSTLGGSHGSSRHNVRSELLRIKPGRRPSSRVGHCRPRSEAFRNRSGRLETSHLSVVCRPCSEERRIKLARLHLLFSLHPRARFDVFFTKSGLVLLLFASSRLWRLSDEACPNDSVLPASQLSKLLAEACPEKQRCLVPLSINSKL
mmetsp:Transcript_14820/g.28232  ORF Transcript_14820/g.28232 Transcript_14820/m.28232 type:complete len:222 (-) Transcript_14820:1111-1776(-)